ncbi:aminoglycoside 6'-N-acetyltransferase [Salinicoccus carnicancri]|uniref:aminoglycoside 6'-N-acetyltransferase n=1 Tax=Salinicoccus carnicancri TaxID=558170 RepID=UPI0002F661AB|nr:aminoglycoside 6'-N-acetyltransferase [Salinicoccus carnicancri]
MIIEATASHIDEMTKLASVLWDEGYEILKPEIEENISKDDTVHFMKMVDDNPVAFAHCGLRYDYVEGTDSSPVGYLEGVFVKEEHRLKNIASELVTECEQWAKDRGCMEFASDCELDNAGSLEFHLKSGFEEMNRIVCFRKSI